MRTKKEAVILKKILAKLVSLESTPLPFLSAYIDLTPELSGSHQSEAFRQDPPPLKSWRREAFEHPETHLYRQGTTVMRDLLREKSQLFEVRGADRDSYNADAERITAYMDEKFDHSMQGLAIYACSGENIWEVVELPVPVRTQLVIDRTPFISPLAYIENAYDRYALCLADSQTARVYVVGLGRAEQEETIDGPAVNRTMIGGLSQQRIQQRIQNTFSDHIREVAHRLEEIVFAEDIPHIILSGDEYAQVELRNHLSERAWERVVEVNRLDTKLPADAAISQTLETILEAERSDGRDIARRAIDATLADGLGAAGAEAVLYALRMGAVDTLVLDAAHKGDGAHTVQRSDIADANEPNNSREEMVTLALQTGAVVEFVEGSDVLVQAGGIAALLRWHPVGQLHQVAADQKTPDHSEPIAAGV